MVESVPCTTTIRAIWFLLESSLYFIGNFHSVALVSLGRLRPRLPFVKRSNHFAELRLLMLTHERKDINSLRYIS